MLLLPILLCSVVFLSAQVKSDYDKEADFTQYKTYTFKGWEKNSDEILNKFDKERILNSFASELAKRGFTKDDSNPDVGITLFLVVDNKTSTTAYTSYNGGMGYGMGRWGWGMGMGGMGSATTSYSEDDYQQGTLVVDFYDSSSKALVWQGVYTGVVKDKPKKREKSIPKNVAKLMKQYPVAPVK
ncbi:MAG: hypothetical protein DHS20C17_35070 [Cyclobacteriaceae bacterium]|nr:MAG: hypothetical protein DHS20C17_35070 [Cyclobacteriaceae bacterium]